MNIIDLRTSASIAACVKFIHEKGYEISLTTGFNPATGSSANCCVFKDYSSNEILFTVDGAEIEQLQKCIEWCDAN